MSSDVIIPASPRKHDGMTGVLAAVILGVAGFGGYAQLSVTNPPVHVSDQQPGSSHPMKNENPVPHAGQDHVTKEAASFSKDMSLPPEVRHAFSVVEQGKALMHDQNKAIDDEALRKKAAREIGYAPPAAPRRDIEPVQNDSDFTGIEVMTGNPVILSGNTLSLSGQVFHLVDTLAPDEHDTCRNAGNVRYGCAAWAKDSLVKIVGDNLVSCDPVAPGADSQDAICFLHPGDRSIVDLSTWLARAGVALVPPEADQERKDAQEEAYREKRGVWSGSIDTVKPLAMSDLP